MSETIATTIASIEPHHLLSDASIQEGGATILMVAAVMGLFTKWLNNRRKADFEAIETQRADDIRQHVGTHALQDQKALQAINTLQNQQLQITALSLKSDDHTVRIARLELALENITEGQRRMEHSQERLSLDLKNGFEAMRNAQYRNARPNA